MLRFLLWRLLGLLGAVGAFGLLGWFLSGGPGRVLRGRARADTFQQLLGGYPAAVAHTVRVPWAWRPELGIRVIPLLLGMVVVAAILLLGMRCSARRRRRYIRLVVRAYRTDQAELGEVVKLIEALHKRLLSRWWRRLILGQPSIALEVHYAGAGAGCAWLGVSCPQGLEPVVEAALQGVYPNCRVATAEHQVGVAPELLRLKKRFEFIRRGKPMLERYEKDREPCVNRLMTVMGACGEPAFVQLALTPAPAAFESFARYLFKHHEARVSRERHEHLHLQDRSFVQDAELRGGLDVQHRPLFFVDLRVVAPSRVVCERIASELRVDTAENRLVERGTTLRHGVLGLYGRRVQRGEGNPLPPFRKGVFASTELASLWQLPSVDYTTVPFERSSVPIAPAPPGIYRPQDGAGTLRDARGPVSIHVELRKQNTAVPGTVEQGKSSYLVATVAEDVRRERCALIVLDPKGDAAEAALSVVPDGRTCTLLDFANPTCGFNPLAVDAPADVIADYVVAALKNLFTDSDGILAP